MVLLPSSLPAPARAGSAVYFLDHRRTQWRAHETDVPAVDGQRASRCLVISSDAAVRRVRNYPSNWRTLTAEALVELLSAR